MSMKARDTLGVKIQGGPVMPLMCDVAKNSEYLLNPDALHYYTYSMEMPVKIDERLHYVVNMTPNQITLFRSDYNIIEPTESLEKAIDKLKKKVRK